jgi:hypothetical protein
LLGGTFQPHFDASQRQVFYVFLCLFYISPSPWLLHCHFTVSVLLWQHQQQTFTTFFNGYCNNSSRMAGLTAGDFKLETLRL